MGTIGLVGGTLAIVVFAEPLGHTAEGRDGSCWVSPYGQYGVARKSRGMKTKRLPSDLANDDARSLLSRDSYRGDNAISYNLRPRVHMCPGQLTKMVDGVLQRLLPGMDMDASDWSVHVIRDDSNANASVLPGYGSPPGLR